MTRAVFSIARLAGVAPLAGVAALAGGALLAGLMSSSAIAVPVTDAETKYCAHDYRQYCSEDGLGSNLLTLCMRKHGKELSKDCINALEAAGELTVEEEAEVDATGD